MLGRLGLGLFAVMTAAACSAAPTQEEPAANADAIIGGVDATGAEFNAIGQLRFIGNDGNGSNCTGTLIAPNVVLTAKHCVMDKPGQEGSGFRLDQGKVYFLVGPDGHHPLAAVRATKVATSALFRGGFTGLGSDVAIYTLEQSIPSTAIAPLTIAANPPSAADVGTAFIAIGYGTQDAQGTSSTRKTGKVTIRTVTGAPAHDAFPTVDAWVAAQDATIPGTFTPEQLDAMKARYDAPLSNDYEVYAGNAAGDVQICHGDSGGPLLKRENGKLVIYGVASTTMAQVGQLCKSGSMYAVFGASTREIIAKSVGDTCAPEGDTTKLACGLESAPTSCAALAPAPPADGAAPTPPSPVVECLSKSCCAETTSCFGDPECSALASCFQACTDQACATACYKARPGSYTKYLGFTTCRKQCAPAPTTTPATETETAPPASTTP